jgi:hypothetical protein
MVYMDLRDTDMRYKEHTKEKQLKKQIATIGTIENINYS